MYLKYNIKANIGIITKSGNNDYSLEISKKTKNNESIFYLNSTGWIISDKKIFDIISEKINTTLEHRNLESEDRELVYFKPKSSVDFEILQNEEMSDQLFSIKDKNNFFKKYLFMSYNLYNLIEDYISNNQIITFDDDSIQYSSSDINAKRFEKNKYSMLGGKMNLIRDKDNVKQCMIDGSNAEFLINDSGNENPGILWSKSEDIAYEAWERGDDPRRTPIIYKK